MTDSPAASKIVRTFRFRLEPTNAQACSMGQFAGACRYLYNTALEQRRDWWRQYKRVTGRHISYIGQTYELTQLRAEVDWLREVPRDALDLALADLDRAFQAYFAGRAAYPNYRKRDDGCGFSVRGRNAPIERLNAKWGRVRLPKIGWVKVRLTREDAEGEPKIVSLRQEGAIGWFANVTCEVAAVARRDVGRRASALTVASPTRSRFPPASRCACRRLSRPTLAAVRRPSGCSPGARRVLERRNKQSAPRLPVCGLVERRARVDWLHRTSMHIVRRFGLVAVEALNIKNMTASAAGTVAEPGKGVAQKRGLNRSILAQGWGQFERMLAYKLEASGGALIRVPAAYTSQTCAACGVVDSRSRESQARARASFTGVTRSYHAEH